MNEGDAYNAANANAQVDGLIIGVNGLDIDDDVEPRALHTQHLVGLLADDASTQSNKGDEMQVTVSAADWPGGNAFENYSNELSPAGANPRNFQVFAGIGPGAGVGWRRVARAGSTTHEGKVVWPSGTTISQYQRLTLTASVCIGDFALGEGLSTVNSCFSLAIAIKDNGSNYYCLPLSIYCYNAMSVMGQRLSITTHINQAILAAAAVAHGGTATITEAVLVFGRWEAAEGGAVSNIAGVGHVELGPYNISALPLRAGTM